MGLTIRIELLIIITAIAMGITLMNSITSRVVQHINLPITQDLSRLSKKQLILSNLQHFGNSIVNHLDIQQLSQHQYSIRSRSKYNSKLN